jgi:hypothetical protein
MWPPTGLRLGSCHSTSERRREHDTSGMYGASKAAATGTVREKRWHSPHLKPYATLALARQTGASRLNRSCRGGAVTRHLAPCSRRGRSR